MRREGRGRESTKKEGGGSMLASDTMQGFGLPRLGGCGHLFDRRLSGYYTCTQPQFTGSADTCSRSSYGMLEIVRHVSCILYRFLRCVHSIHATPFIQ